MVESPVESTVTVFEVVLTLVTVLGNLVSDNAPLHVLTNSLLLCECLRHTSP